MKSEKEKYVKAEAEKVAKVLTAWKADPAKSREELGVMPWGEDSEKDPLNEWELDVINTGPNAAVSIYDAKMEAAVRAFNTDWNVDAYRHGQTTATGVGQDLSIHVNGIDEFTNDGVNFMFKSVPPALR